MKELSKDEEELLENSSAFDTKGTLAPLNVSDQSKNGIGLRTAEGQAPIHSTESELLHC